MVPVDDVDRTASAIRRLASDPALRRSLGRAAEMRARDRCPDRVLPLWYSLMKPGAAVEATTAT